MCFNFRDGTTQLSRQGAFLHTLALGLISQSGQVPTEVALALENSNSAHK